MAFVRSLTANAGLKAFSLAVSVLLFAFVSNENSTPLEADFRVEYRLADDIMLVSDAPPVVHTTLRGPWAAFRSFDPGELEPVIVALQDAGPGRLRHSIDLARIHPPGGMRVVSVRPTELEVELDRRVTREVPVHADIAQAPAFGFQMFDVRLVPARVRVVGPASKMLGLEYVSTRPIDIHEREDDLNLEVEVRPPPPPLRLQDRRVTAFVEIGEEMSQRTFTDVTVEVRGAPPGSECDPPSVTFTLKGPRKVIDRLTGAGLATTVDVASEAAAGAERTSKPVALQQSLPERTQLVGQLPRVEVQLGRPRPYKRRGRTG